MCCKHQWFACGNFWEHDWGASAGSSTKQNIKIKTALDLVRRFSIQATPNILSSSTANDGMISDLTRVWLSQKQVWLGGLALSAEHRHETGPDKWSDTAQGPQVWPGQLLLHRELSKSRLYRDNSSQDIYWLTWELSPFGNSASNNSPKAKALWRIWGLVLETRPQHSQLCFLGKEEVSSPINKYLLRLLCLLTQISNSLNCIFDFQMWLYQVSKSQS